MRETSDIMQELAWAYGERQTMEACLRSLWEMKNAENKRIMTTIYKVYGIECIRRDLSWYLIQGVISKAALAKLSPTRNTLIKEIAGKVTDIMDCLNIAKESLYAPIASDYVKYNASPNNGEIIGAPRL